MAIFWLTGMAGTGKTSIAMSLCRMLREDPDVLFGGGYFCSRSTGSIARTDVRRILPTLAALLAGRSQEFATALAAELEKDLRVSHKPVVEQVGPLLSRPLGALASSSRPLIFVIDALDEFSSERELADLLKAIADFKSDARVKFILTSRPEIHIRGSSISNPNHNDILYLHSIVPEEVKSDIWLYISNTLTSAAGGASWYTEHDIRLLVNLSAGLFIFASTVIAYILEPDEDEDREDRLRKVTSMTVAEGTGTVATSTVDRAYELVLTEASRSDIIDGDELERMRTIVICILTARTPLSVQALAELLDLKPARIRGSLRRLHSLIRIPRDDTEPRLQTLHASFGDFLFRRAPQHLRISVTLGHNALAHGCLRRMARNDLCFNIARSRSSFEPNAETQPHWIALSLIYACLNWAHHVDASSDPSAFDKEIGNKFRPKFLFWLELLSIMGKMGLASGLLRIAISVVKQGDIEQFLRDANSFVASSHTAISRSAAHIYVSALPFTAKDSFVYREFSTLCTGVVSVRAHGSKCRSRIVMTLIGHEGAVRSVIYSPDGRFLISGSSDGTVRIWDTRTGEETISPLRGGDGEVLSVAVAPNGQRVASGTDSGTVHVWDMVTGHAVLQPLRGHTARVRSVAYSPDGTLIASGSDDQTIRIWDAETGQTVSVMDGHEAQVRAVAFSPDSRLLASASFDKTVRLWKPRTGKAVRTPLTGIEDSIMCLAFSPNGKYLTAGSQNTHVVRMWDVHTLKPIYLGIWNGSSVRSLAFSPRDGSKLVSVGWQRIRFWDAGSGRELSDVSLPGHLNWVYSVAFSPDEKFLASSSGDRTIRIWDATGSLGSVGQSPQSHSEAVTSVAVSRDGTSIVSSSADKSVRVWNAATGEARFEPLSGQTGYVNAVAISPDSRLIASASFDSTIRLWVAQTGHSVGKPLRGHKGQVYVVTFSPDSQWLASGSRDQSVRIWEVATRRIAPFGPLQCTQEIRTVVFSPDRRYIAAGGSRGYIHIWYAGTGQPARAALQASSRGVRCIGFSPSGKMIVSGAEDNAIRVWSVDGGYQAFALNGHTDWVCSVEYSPDGLYIVSASDDKSVRLWNAEMPGAAVATLYGHSDAVRSAVFMPDGRSIVSGAKDHTIHVWEVEAACSLLSRAKRDPIAKLGSAKLDRDSWLVGSSGELLLWLPLEYGGCIQLPPCSMIIGPHQVDLTAENGLRWGKQWTACWRNTVQSST